MAELANCDICSKVYVKTLRDICEACYKEEEKKFEHVYKFIRKRENRMASMADVVEGTGVEEKLIIRFIKEGRLHLAQFPNLGYPCTKCGKTIKEGKLCGDCVSTLRKDITDLSEQEKRAEEKKKRERAVTYHTINKSSRRY